MNNPPLHSGAVHEAGHAVMARLLQVRVGRITIDLADPNASARACIESTNPHNMLRIAAASAVCLRAFGYDTQHDRGPYRDEAVIENALSELTDDEASYPQRRRDVIAEVERWFEQPGVRAAVVALVTALMRTGGIDGLEATAIIDRHLMAGKAPPSTV